MALEAVRRGQKAPPDDPRLIEREGDCAGGPDDPGRRRRAYERVAQLAPTDALVRVKLGELYRDMRAAAATPRGCCARPCSSIRQRRRTGTRSAWCSAAKGDLPAPSRRFAKRRPRRRKREYTYNLGLALLRQQRAGEAALQFRRALEIRPDVRARAPAIGRGPAVRRPDHRRPCTNTKT